VAVHADHLLVAAIVDDGYFGFRGGLRCVKVPFDVILSEFIEGL
jgi:hypothetical protein